MHMRMRARPMWWPLCARRWSCILLSESRWWVTCCRPSYPSNHSVRAPFSISFFVLFPFLVLFFFSTLHATHKQTGVRSVLWVLGEYSTSAAHVAQAFHAIKTSLGTCPPLAGPAAAYGGSALLRASNASARRSAWWWWQVVVAGLQRRLARRRACCRMCVISLPLLSLQGLLVSTEVVLLLCFLLLFSTCTFVRM